MIDAGKVVEDDAETRLELLPELPCTWDGGGGVVKDVANEEEACDFPRYRSAVNQKGCHNYIADLKMIL